MLLQCRYIKTPYKCSDAKILYLAIREQMQPIYCFLAGLLRIENNTDYGCSEKSTVEVVEKAIYLL